MAYYLSPFGNTPVIVNGVAVVGGSIKTYLAGTSTPETTYTDNTGGTAQGVSMTLDANGLPENGPVWMLGGVPLKFRFFNAAGVSILDDQDNISGIGDTATVSDEWVLYGSAPTYISATSFSVVGDQTNTFQPLRKLKSENSGGTIYGFVFSSVFSAGITTVVVTNTSGTLDSGLSAVSYGQSAINPSAPAIGLLTVPPMNIYGGAATRSAIGTGLAANLLATTTPVRLSFPAGIGPNGRVDYPGTLIADATGFWSGLTASTTNYLFYNRDSTTGVITGVSSALPYIAQDSGVAVSVVNGQHTYVTDTNLMYVGNGSAATAVQRVPEGECVTSGVAVTGVTSYAKNRKYTSAWTATLPVNSVQVSSNHNLGTQEFIGQFEAECTTNDNGFVVGDRIDLLSHGLSGTNTFAIAVRKGRLSMSISTMNGSATPFGMAPAAGGASISLTNASWKYRFVCLPKF